jgi:hypothetical protein
MSATLASCGQDDDGAHRRQAPRRDMYLWGTARALGHPGERLLVLNLSKSGFMGETAADFDHGCFIEVTLPGIGLVRACVVWREKGKVGARFLRPI